MDGWAGKILRIDLSRRDCAVEGLDPVMARDYIGGRGLGVKFLYDEVDPTVEPFSADNKLIFAVGLLTGTGAPSGGRHFVVTKSPLTGGIATSNAAGQFCTELKFAGYDMIIFEGKASEPVYIVINDDDIEIRSAKNLWGKSTSETEDIIKAEVGDKWKAREVCVACIGPAGEKLVRLASIINDKTRAAARSGIGAVMGAKNLKAIVVRGTKDVNVADGEALKEAVLGALEKIKESAVLRFINTDGTLGAIWLNNKFGALPVRNFLEGSFEGVAAVSSRALKANFLVRTYACAACPVACGRVTRVRVEGLEGAGGGPEFETTAKLGPGCGVDNLAAIIKANYLCNELGMDTISVGGTISCAMELYEKGYLSEKEAGYKLNFGNAEALVELVEKMGLRQDFGDVLAEGGYRVADRYGHPELFMGSKKQELPAYNIQALQGTGLGFATSNRGACHNRAEMHLPEMVELAGGSVGIEGKAALCKERQDSHAVVDSTGLCLFLTEEGLWPDYVLRFMEAATGAGYTLDSVMLAGERIWNMERLFNVGAGLTAKDDTLPKRILEEFVLKGPLEGQVNRLGEMLPEYYRLRGWDENGVPTKGKLAELGIVPNAVRQA